DPHVVERIDDAFGNRIVPAARTQGGLAAFVHLRFQPDSIRSSRSRHIAKLSEQSNVVQACCAVTPSTYSPPVIPADPPLRTVFLATSYPSCASTSSLMLRASMGRPL